MKIGTDESYLRIERSDATEPYSSYLLEGRHSDSHSSFHGSCDVVVFDSGDALRDHLEAFKCFQSHSLEIRASGGCRLGLSRDNRGNIRVRYRICYWKQGADTGLDGVVEVDGEHSQNFIKELSEMILGSSQQED